MSVEGRRPRHKPDGDSHNGSAADSDSARGSSILSSPTTPQQPSCCGFFFTGCSAVGSALGSGPRGRGFESRHSDHKPVTKKMSQAYFFVVTPKNGNFRQPIFWTLVLQCCPTILGRFAHLDSHFSADFWNLAGEGAIFLRKNRINPAVFRMFSISSQPISCWLRGFFVFFDSFQFVFKFSILYLL